MSADSESSLTTDHGPRTTDHSWRLHAIVTLIGLAWLVLAGRLVQHQRTTEPAPQAILISLPEEGNVYSFRRSVQVAENTPLELELQFNSQDKLRPWQWLMLAGLVGLIAAGLARKTRSQLV